MIKKALRGVLWAALGLLMMAVILTQPGGVEPGRSPGGGIAVKATVYPPVNRPSTAPPSDTPATADYAAVYLYQESAELPLGSPDTPLPAPLPLATPPPLIPLPSADATAPLRPTPHAEILETSFRDYMVSRGSHDVAITIDDGPSPNTPALLRVLAEEGARATFFVIGNRVNLFPDYARQIVAEGHEIANHSWSHFSLENGGSTSYGIWQFRYAEEVILGATGVRGPLLIRIPYGKVYSSVIRTLGREGRRFVMWSIDTKDWAHHDGERTLAACSGAGPGDIILIHSQATSAETLRAMIRMLRGKGLSCITVSEMLGLPKPVKPPDADADMDLSLP